MGKREEIGINIRTMRKSRNMTQEDLARSINQSPSSITMYETGRRSPDYETLEALADVFNVPISIFIDPGRDLLKEKIHFSEIHQQPEDPSEKKLVETYRMLNSEGKKYLLQQCDVALNSYRKKYDDSLSKIV